MRYFAPRDIAGLACTSVSVSRRLPRPPVSTKAMLARIDAGPSGPDSALDTPIARGRE